MKEQGEVLLDGGGKELTNLLVFFCIVRGLVEWDHDEGYICFTRRFPRSAQFVGGIQPFLMCRIERALGSMSLERDAPMRTQEPVQ